MELLDQIQAIVTDAETALASAKTENDVEAVRTKTVGRNGAFTALGPLMGKVPADQKPVVGKAFNVAKQTLLAKIEEAKNRIADSAEESSAEKIDVTLPGRKWHAGRKHPVCQTFDECCNIFRRMGFIATSGPEIETVFNNFDALNAPADHPSRSMVDTFYFEDGRIMRSHTSPVQIRTMLAQGLILVAAGGNAPNETLSFPQDIEGVINIAGIKRDRTSAGLNDNWAKDFAAFGNNVPLYTSATGATGTNGGSSFAAPMATAILRLSNSVSLPFLLIIFTCVPSCWEIQILVVSCGAIGTQHKI